MGRRNGRRIKDYKEEGIAHKFWNYEDLEDICNLNRPDIYQAAYAIHKEPFNFLKERVASLRVQLFSEFPNLFECRNLIQQIREFFNETI